MADDKITIELDVDSKKASASIDEVQKKSISLGSALKEIGKVVKANDLLKHMTNEDVIILLNERVFFQLEDEQKNMVVEELIARVYFDAEKSKITIINPDVNTFSLLLRKYGYDKYERLNESIKAIFAQEDEVESN
jgi:hypothetical protein